MLYAYVIYGVDILFVEDVNVLDDMGRDFDYAYVIDSSAENLTTFERKKYLFGSIIEIEMISENQPFDELYLKQNFNIQILQETNPDLFV